MKIVFVSIWYSENMGYLENCLPQAIARLGHEVHILTSTAQVYFNQPHYDKSYRKYLGDSIQAQGIKTIDGVYIHRLPFTQMKSKIILKGLSKELAYIRPDIVHTLEHVSIDSLKLAFLKLRYGFKLYTANHAVRSVYPIAKNWHTLSLSSKLKWWISEWLLGRFVGFFIEKCFAVTSDAGEIAHEYRGVPLQKIKVTTLGVDTHLFSPNEEERQIFRAKWGFKNNDIICIYTGKLIAQKQPILLARAIEEINKKGDKRYKGFFVAEGELADEIKAFANIQIIPLQPFKELPNFFRMADIAIWPGEESSSQLDAVAAGACLLLTDNIQAYEVIETEKEVKSEKPVIVSRKFKHGDLDDLITQLEYLSSAEKRRILSNKGVQEMRQKYSWDIIAQNRLDDYNS